MLNKSNLLLWSYRAALIASVWALLIGFHIFYNDVAEGQWSQAAGGVALCFAAIVLAVTVVLGRRIRRRSKDIAYRLQRTQQHLDKLAKFVLAMPGELEQRLQQQFQNIQPTPPTSSMTSSTKVDTVEEASGQSVAQTQSVIVEQPVGTTTGSTPSSTDYPAQDTAEVMLINEHLDGALQQALWLLSEGREVSKDSLQHWRELKNQLRHVDAWTSDLQAALDEVECGVVNKLRVQFAGLIKSQTWLEALQVGDTIKAVLPDSDLAKDVIMLEGRISSRIQREIEDRRDQRPSAAVMQNRPRLQSYPEHLVVDPEPIPEESSVQLHLADEVAKSA